MKPNTIKKIEIFIDESSQNEIENIITSISSFLMFKSNGKYLKKIKRIQDIFKPNLKQGGLSLYLRIPNQISSVFRKINIEFLNGKTDYKKLLECNEKTKMEYLLRKNNIKIFIIDKFKYFYVENKDTFNFIYAFYDKGTISLKGTDFFLRFFIKVFLRLFMVDPKITVFINLYLINYTVILNEFKKLHKILDNYEKKINKKLDNINTNIIKYKEKSYSKLYEETDEYNSYTKLNKELDKESYTKLNKELIKYKEKNSINLDEENKQLID